MTKICEICVMVYVTKLMELERALSDWQGLNLPELLLAVGEELSEENLIHMELAKELL